MVIFEKMVEFSVLTQFYFLSRPISLVQNLSTHRHPRKAPRHRPPGTGTNHKLLRVDGRVSTALSLTAVITVHWRLVAGGPRGTNGSGEPGEST